MLLAPQPSQAVGLRSHVGGGVGEGTVFRDSWHHSLASSQVRELQRAREHGMCPLGFGR